MLAMEAATASGASDLAGYLDRSQVLVSRQAYEEARRVWNGAIDHRPALIVRLWTSGDVQATVRAAVSTGYRSRYSVEAMTGLTGPSGPAGW